MSGVQRLAAAVAAPPSTGTRPRATVPASRGLLGRSGHPRARCWLGGQRAADRRDGLRPRRCCRPAGLPDPELLLYLGRTRRTRRTCRPGTVVLGAVYDDRRRPRRRASGPTCALEGAPLERPRRRAVRRGCSGSRTGTGVAGFSPRTGLPDASPAAAAGCATPRATTAESSGEHVFPRTDPAVIMGVVDGRRPAAARLATPAWPERPLLRARRLRRAGRVVRGRGAPRGVRGGRRARRRPPSTSARSRGRSRPAVMVGFLARTGRRRRRRSRAPDGERDPRGRAGSSREELPQRPRATDLLLPAAPRSPGPSSSTGTAASSRATGDDGDATADRRCSTPSTTSSGRPRRR